MEKHIIPTPARSLSLEQFERLPEAEGYRLELVGGRLVREPAPAPRHGRVTVDLAVSLATFVRAHDLGVVLANVGFVLAEDPPTVRVPDLAFVARGRIPANGYDAGFWRFSPDLAVEILSPSNTNTEIQAKVSDYLRAGSRLVWVVAPRRRTVTVYRSRGDVRIIAADGELDGGAPLPGFRLPIAELFGV